MHIQITAKSKVEIEARTWKAHLEDVILPIGTEFDLLLIPTETYTRVSIEKCHVDIPPAYFVVVGSDSNRRDISEFEIPTEIIEKIKNAGFSVESSKGLPGQVFDNDDETGKPSKPFETLVALHDDRTQELNPLALQGRE